VTDLVETLARLFEVGGVVVVTAMLYLVWQRLNTLTDKLIDILSEIQSQGLITRAPDPHDDHEL